MPSSSPTKASATERTISGAIARAVAGEWLIYTWESFSSIVLPEGAADYGITEVWELPNYFKANGNKPMNLHVKDGTYQLSGIDFEILEEQLGGRNHMEGTWVIRDGIATVTVPIVKYTEYYSTEPTAAFLPDSVAPADGGQLRWEFNKGQPDLVTYEIGEHAVHVEIAARGTLHFLAVLTA